MPMLLALAALVLAAAAYLAGEVVTQPAREHLRSVQRAATYGRLRQSGPGLERLHFRARVLDPAVQSIARIVLRVSPKMTTEVIAGRLLAAGMSGTITPTSYLAAKGAGAAGGLFVGFVLGGALGGAGAALPIGLVFGGFGFIAPGVVVSLRSRRRREAIRAQLPDALDLLAVSVEAGLGFDGAVAKLTEHMEGALAEEFSLTLGEMRIGESRHDALKKLAARAASPEVSSFSRAIIQADQLGISLGRILRVQATDSRLKRQDAAEERAMKSPIKMLFPTVIFIFPAMFIVILGPAFLQLSKLFEL
jgi:tight adherence protein C